MANLVFLLDYAPILVKSNKSAMIIYEFYDKFKDDTNTVVIKYEELVEHLGLATSTIRDAHKVLKNLKLIEPFKQSEVKAKKFQSVPYRMLPVVPISENKEALEYAENELNVSIQKGTKLRERFIREKLPSEYLDVLDVGKMKKAIENLGDVKSQIANCLATEFGLDRNMFKLLMEDKGFRENVVKTKREAKEAVSDSGSTKTTVSSTKKDIKVPKAYEQLMSVHISRKTKQEMKIDEWKSPQLLRYFCLCYEREYKVPYTFSKEPWNSKQMKDMKRILTAFKDDAQRATAYVDWVFVTKRKVLDGIDSGILAHDRMINEFNRKQNGTIQNTQITRNSSLPTNFLEWVGENVPNVDDFADCKTYYDLYWIREEHLQSGEDTPPELKALIAEAIKRELVPEGGNIEFAK